MASGDATAIPVKNQAYRCVFPILDADGDLVTGATGLDSEVSKDQGTFADATSEATEIATSSGIYYLDLTATEMNADCVAVIVKTTSSGAKTTVLVFYPQEAGDINVDVTYWNGTAVATPTTGGVPEVDVTHWLGTAAATPTVAGVPEVDITHIGGTAVTAAAGIPEVKVASLATGSITAAAIATDAIDADALAADAVTEIWNKAMSDLAAVPGATASALAALNWLFELARNKLTQTATTGTVLKDDGSTALATTTVSDDGVTFTRGEWT